MKKKRFLVTLLCAVMSVTTIGCGHQSEEKKETAASGSSEVAKVDEATEVDKATEVVEEVDPFGKYEEEITLHLGKQDSGAVFYPGYEDFEDYQNNAWMTSYKEDLGINVVVDWYAADAATNDTKWNLAMAQGNVPDFGMVSASTFQKLLDGGYCMDMTDIIEEYASPLVKEMMATDEIGPKFVTEDGRLMAIPKIGYTPYGYVFMAYRQDWLDELDMEVPKTMDDLLELCRAFVKNEMGGEDTLGMALHDGIRWQWLTGLFNAAGSYFESGGIGWMEEDGELINGNIREENKELILWMQTLYEEGLMNKDFTVATQSVTDALVTSGKVGIVPIQYWQGSLLETAKANDPDAEWVIADIPTLDGSPCVYHMATGYDGAVMFVNKDCENPEAVMKIINLETERYLSNDAEVLAAYRTAPSPTEEDKTVNMTKYTVSGGAVVEKPNGLPNLWKHINAAVESGDTSTLTTEELNNYNKLLSWTEDGEITGYRYWVMLSEGGTRSLVAHATDEGRVVQSAYATRNTELMSEKAYPLQEELEAAIHKVIMGEDISVWDKAVEDWYKNGGQEMLDEGNAWYDSMK